MSTNALYRCANIRRACLLIASMVLSVMQAHAKPPFVWLKAVNSSPSSGVENRDIDGSTAALLFPLVSADMPQQIEANFERQFKLLETVPDACSGKKIYTVQRANHLYYSDLPQLFSVGLRLYVREDAALLPALQAISFQGEISLLELSETLPKLMMGAVAGRSYTAELDMLLQQFAQRSRLWLRHADDMATGMTLMLALNRVDAVIEYPTIMADLTQVKPFKLRSFAIKETPAFTNGFIVCAATVQGQALISRFNQAIALASKKRSYLEAHLKWFEPALHAEITRYYNALYGTQFK